MNKSTAKIVLAGAVSATGAVLVGKGFHSEHISPGYFRVSFIERVNAQPIVLVTLDAGPGNAWTGAVTLHNVQQDFFEVSIHDLGSAYCDIPFHFAVLV
uniref:hypothetical protein n=1 Tax=Roseivirga sp. TaxID=1964215 RepID=UPI004047DA79